MPICDDHTHARPWCDMFLDTPLRSSIRGHLFRFGYAFALYLRRFRDRWLGPYPPAYPPVDVSCGGGFEMRGGSSGIMGVTVERLEDFRLNGTDGTSTWDLAENSSAVSAVSAVRGPHARRRGDSAGTENYTTEVLNALRSLARATPDITVTAAGAAEEKGEAARICSR